MINGIKSDYPEGATPITGASGNVAAATATAALAGVVGKTTFITGFEATASGATAGLPVLLTVVGTVTGTLTYIFTARNYWNKLFADIMGVKDE